MAMAMPSTDSSLDISSEKALFTSTRKKKNAHDKVRKLRLPIGEKHRRADPAIGAERSGSRNENRRIQAHWHESTPAPVSSGQHPRAEQHGIH